MPGLKRHYIAEIYEVVTPIFSKEMGERLRLMRMKLKLRQQDLAELLGVHQKTVSAFELGMHKTAERPFSVAKLQEVFGKLTLFILLGTNPERFNERVIGQKHWTEMDKRKGNRKSIRTES